MNEPIKNKRTYEAMLDETRMNTYKLSINQSTPQQPKHIIQQKYNILLEGKITDEQLKRDIALYANQIIRHRVSAVLVCRNMAQPKEVCSAEIVGILPEDEELVRNYFINLVVMSNLDWQNKLNTFKQDMTERLKTVLSVRPVVSPTTTIHITNAILTVQFK